MKRRAIPTRADWGDLSKDPEIRYAWKLFGGKSIEDAAQLFIDNPIERGAEIRFCTTTVFSYYIFCFVDFLLSPSSSGESDVASCFIHLVRDRARDDKGFQPVLLELLPTIEDVASRQGFYGAEPGIYGSFSRLAAHCRDFATGSVS